MSPAPYQPPMSAHIQQMPCYRRPRERQCQPAAESMSAYPRVRVRLRRAHSPCIPTSQEYEDSAGPTTAISPQDPTTRTHAQARAPAQGLGPAHGLW